MDPQKINQIVEKVLQITLNPNHTNKEQLALITSDEKIFTMDLLDYCFFEHLISMSGDDHKVILYLYNSFSRLNIEMRNDTSSEHKDIYEKLKTLVVRNACTAFVQPALFADQNISNQLLDIYKNSEEEDPSLRDKFLSQIIKKSLEDQDSDASENLRAVIFRCFDDCLRAIRQFTMISLENWVITFLMTFVSDKTNAAMANLLLDYTTPPENANGIKYADSLFGQLLCLSIMPKNNNGPYEYYENLHNTSLVALNNLSSSLWNYLKILHDSLHLLIKGFLVIGGETKDKCLQWIGRAITSNVKRGQIWNTHYSTVLGNYTTAPDSFMIGLSGVLLRLCLPLMKPQLKVILTDPTYSAVKNEETAEKQMHLKDFDKETCLIPFDENEERVTASKYNFITELFFMTHKSIDLSYRTCIEKVMRMNREIGRIQQAYQDSQAQGAPADMIEQIMNTLTTQSQQLLCLQNLILEPRNDELLCNFFLATALWTNELAATTSIDAQNADKGFAPQKLNDVKLPLPNEASVMLKYVPEMVLENIVSYLQFGKNFDVHVKHNNEAKNVFITMILIFMGSAQRAKNPHLRANLAEGLESLLPRENQSGFTLDTQLFHEHIHRFYVVENLLNVFVSIEMTGQSVTFEQKFNYRRPMYAIMEYLWKIPEQRECFKRLSLEAETNMDSVEAPIFLRFVNVLINDSIFLLDESLTNLQQIRELEEARDNGKWESLPQNERQQNLQNLQQLSMLARFDNILGKDTLNILKLLTSEAKAIFCHSSMVDRIASMLNYFLLNLVGPKQKNFKVSKHIAQNSLADCNF